MFIALLCVSFLSAVVVGMLFMLRGYADECAILEQIIVGQANHIAFLKETQMPSVITFDWVPSNDNKTVH